MLAPLLSQMCLGLCPGAGLLVDKGIAGYLDLTAQVHLYTYLYVNPKNRAKLCTPKRKKQPTKNHFIQYFHNHEHPRNTMHTQPFKMCKTLRKKLNRKECLSLLNFWTRREIEVQLISGDKLREAVLP